MQYIYNIILLYIHIPPFIGHIKKYRNRLVTREELFPDLRDGQLYPLHVLQIDRVLDVDDVFTVQWNPTTIDWMKAMPPPLTTTADAAADGDGAVAVEEEGEVEMKAEAEAGMTSSPSTDTSFASPTPSQSQSPCEGGKSKKTRRTKKQKVETDVPAPSTDTEALDEAEWEDDQPSAKSDSPKRSPRTKAAKPTVKPTKKATAAPPETQYLHSADSCWLTIKWESLGYSEFTVESVEDVRKAGIDYLWALRDFYR